MEQQFLKESQYKKACEDRDIEEYKEYKRAVSDNDNATAFNREVSEDNLKCMESVVADERNLKKQIIEQCLRGYRVNILHSESCAIPDEIKKLQDAQNALKEKRKTLVKEFKECKTQLMNEWRDIFVNRDRFGQFIGWLRGDRPQSFMDAIDNGSKLHVEKMKYLISIFSKHRDQLKPEIQQLDIKNLLDNGKLVEDDRNVHTVDVEHVNMLFLTISARIATAEKKIAFDSLTPRQYKWRLTYRYLPIFVVPYADDIKDAI